MSKHKVEIDVSLNMEGLSKDFNELEKKAKSGTKAAVSAVSHLAAAMEETGKATKGAGQDFEKTADNMKKASKEASENVDELKQSVDGAKDSTEGLKESEEGLGRQSRETGNDQEGLGDKTEETRQKVEQSREAFISWGDAAKTAIKGTVVVAGTLLTSMGAVVGISAKFGTEYQQASNTVQASTGATAEEMKGLQEVMKNVYAGNFGEDMNDVAEAVANVKKNIGGTDQEIQKTTEAAFGFRDTFGYDIPESTRAASMLMKIFGTDAEHAYDLMAKGAQKGLDFSGEMLDSITEYAPQFAKAGLSAEQMFNIMASGYEAGAWNLDKVGDAVKELNIRLVDGSNTTAEGLKMIGLNADEVAKKMSQGGEIATETYKQVVKGLAEMDDKQAQNIAGVNLFGTMWEDLGPNVVEQLAVMEGAYDNVKGTMDEINDIKYDDAGSALEALKRKAEVSLLLPISQNIMPAISGATEAAIGYIDELASAYESEGVNGLIEEAGEIFADIATNAAEQAPEMVEVAISFIDNTIKGFQANKGRLSEAGRDLTKTLCSAVVQLLPKELQKPVEDAMDDLIDSITGGGIRNGIKTFSNIFENGFKVVSKVTRTVLPTFVKAIDGVADNLDILIPLVTAGAAAFKGYKVVDGVTKSVKASAKAVELLADAEKKGTVAQVAATGAIKAKDVAVALLTGKIQLATAAQTAWNAVMNANPIGLVITAVGALAVGLAVYKLATDDSKESQYALTEEQKKANEEIHKQYEAYKELDSARKEAMESVNAEYGYLTELNNELKSLVDSNGQVKAGYEDRANFIVNQLSEALGIEKEKIWEIIQANGDLGTSIDQIIEKKKAEALLVANEEAYTEAIKNRADALKKYTDQTVEFETAQKNYNSTQETANKVMDEYYSLLQTSPDAANAYLLASQSILKEADEAEAAFKDEKKALKEAEATYIEYNATIQNYEGLSSAIISGDATKISEAMLNIQNSFITAEIGTKTSLENQVKNMQENYAALKQAVEDGVPGVTQAMVDGAKQMVEKSKAELDKFQEKAKESTGKAGDSAAQGFTEKTPAIVSAVEIAAQSAMEKLNSKSPKFQQSGKNSGDSLNKGLSSTKPAIDATSQDISNSLNEKLGSADTQSTGARKTSEYNLGLGSNKGQIDITSKNIAKSSVTLLGSENTKNTGAKKSSEYNSGLGSNKGAVDSTSKTLSNTANTAMGTSDTGSTGKKQSSKYLDGILSKKSASEIAGKSLANKADSGAKSVDGSSAGSGFGSGFVSGINSWIGSAVSAAANLAASALAAAKRAIDSRSPAKKTRKVGHDFDDGFVLGIKDKTNDAVKAAGNFTRRAAEVMKIPDFSFRMDYDEIQNAMRTVDDVVSRQNDYFARTTFTIGSEAYGKNQSNRFLEREAKIIGKAVADVVNDRMEEFKFIFKDRELGRAVREALK